MPLLQSCCLIAGKGRSYPTADSYAKNLESFSQTDGDWTMNVVNWFLLTLQELNSIKIISNSTKREKRKKEICKYDSNKIEHNKTVKLPQALSVVKIFNALPLPTPLLTDVLFFTPSPSPPPQKRRNQRFLGQWNFVESLGQQRGNASEGVVWDRSCVGQVAGVPEGLREVLGRCSRSPPQSKE